MTMSVNNASVFTDLSGLNNIRQLGRDNEAAGLKQVAQQFEAMFLNMMLKSMRAGEDVLFGDNYTNSNEMKFHRQNFDQQLGLHLSETGGVGLADQLYRQLSQRYDIDASAEGPVGDLDTGNTEQSQGLPLPAFRVPVQQRTMSQPQVQEAVQQSMPGMNEAPVFEQPEDFVQALAPAANKIASELGVDSKVLLAQAALETGWGQKMIRSREGHESHNLFGIKSSQNWSGSQVEVSTLEYRDGMVQRERAQFRSYGSFEESFRDYANVLRSNGRYADALNAGSNSDLFAERLQEAGYATDPAYADKMKAVMRHPAIEAIEPGSVIR